MRADIIRPDEIETDTISLPHATRLVWWGRHGGGVFFVMRIRTIKPDFWSHPVMSKQSEATRLVAIGLLNVADDEGYFYADPKLIRNAIRPFDDDSRITTVSIRELSSIGYITMVEHPTHGPIGKIESFLRHQVINKPKPSIIKALHDSSSDTVSIPDCYGLEGKGKEGNKEGNKESLTLPFEDEDFKAAWEDWIQHRKEKKKPLTPTSTKLQLQTLEEMGVKRAIKAIDHSIAQGYTGIYEPNQQKPTNGNKPKTTSCL